MSAAPVAPLGGSIQFPVAPQPVAMPQPVVTMPALPMPTPVMAPPMPLGGSVQFPTFPTQGPFNFSPGPKAPTPGKEGVRKMKCPPGMKGGDQLEAMDPTTGQVGVVQIPKGVSPGDTFKVRV